MRLGEHRFLHNSINNPAKRSSSPKINDKEKTASKQYILWKNISKLSLSPSRFKIQFILSNIHFLNAAVLISILFQLYMFRNNVDEIITTLIKYIKTFHKKSLTSNESHLYWYYRLQIDTDTNRGS